MLRRNQSRVAIATALLFLLCSLPMLEASDGEPLAVRKWPGGLISIETHWGLRVLIAPHPRASKQLPTDADHVIRPSDTLDHYLTRQPNVADVSWLPAAEFIQSKHKNDVNAVHVKSLSTGNDKARALLLAVDGVRIVYIPLDQFATGNRVDPNELKNVDLVILATADVSQLQQADTVSLLKAIQPRRLLLDQIGPEKLDDIKKRAAALAGPTEISTISHNTLAISQTQSAESTEKSDPQTDIVLLGSKPWEMPAELAGLFAEMEKSCADSQQVFAKLSATQLNFRPANGTHTPRWNTEHMMGRQLLFFSQIYHAQDSAIPVIDLNPKQMPDDYVAAHPDWDGAEEARQTKRVSDFTRRFAYLLADVELDTKAAGSRWKLRALLKQMDHHYGEHTANTIKKFELPGWPKE